MKIAFLWIAVSWLFMVSLTAAQASEFRFVAGRIERDTTIDTDVLAVERSPNGDRLGILLSRVVPGTATRRLTLLSSVGQSMLRPLAASSLQFDLPNGSLDPYWHSGLAIDANDRAHVLVSTGSGTMLLATAELRNPNASSWRVKTLRFGDDDIGISRLLVSRSGDLVLAGSVDGKGIIAALSPDGVRRWTRVLEGGIANVRDLVEADDGWIWVGIIPSRFATGHLRVGRLNNDGVMSDSPRQPAETESRFARLARSGDKFGLVYEHLNHDDMRSDVFLEVFDTLASVESRRHLIIEGDRLLSDLNISGSRDGFVVASVRAASGVLRIDQVGSDLTIRSILRSKNEAPLYQAFTDVDIQAGPGFLWIAATEETSRRGGQGTRTMTVSRLAVP